MVYHNMDVNEVKCIVDNIKYVVDNNWLETAASIVTLVIGALNLLFIFIVHITDKKEKKIQAKKDYNFNWYKMIHVDKRISNLNKIIDMVNQSCMNIKNSQNDSLDDRRKMQKELIKNIDKLFIDEKRKFTQIISSVDNKEYIELRNLYNDFQEKYGEVFTNAVAGEDYDFTNLNNITTQIVKKYYDLGNKLLN